MHAKPQFCKSLAKAYNSVWGQCFCMAGVTGKKPEVLIVDGNPENLSAVQKILRNLDVEFACATSGQEAFGLVSEHDYAAAVISAELPDMDGLKVVEWLGRGERNRFLPVILVCKKGSERKAVKAMKRGAYDFMAWPVTPERLRGKIRFLVELYMQRKAGEKHVLKLSESMNKLSKAYVRLRLQTKALKAVDDAIMITDHRGVIVWVNAAFEHLTGYEAREAIGSTPRILKSGQYDARFYSDMWQTIRSGQAWRHEMVDRRKNGSFFTMETAISPICDGRGEVTHFVSVTHDITERKQAEKAREEEIATRTQFISMASHEVRTPLTAIKEGIRLVLTEATGRLNDDQKELLEIARRNSERLSRLINDLLDFQKLKSGKMEFDVRQNDINAVVREIVETMMPLVNERGLELVTDLDTTAPIIVFDKDRIQQVLTNVISNGIKFTREGCVTIRTSCRDNTVQVSVQDTGPGIKSDDLPKLFHEFEQLAVGNGPKTGGSGLGLAISRQIMKKHNAKIWAESELGKGTIVHFVLPIVERRHKLRE